MELHEGIIIVLKGIIGLGLAFCIAGFAVYRNAYKQLLPKLKELRADVDYWINLFNEQISINEQLNAKIARKRQKIYDLKLEVKQLAKTIENWNTVYKKVMEGWKHSDERHMVARTSQGIEIERLKDELKKANEGVNIGQYVEDMSNDYFTLIQEKRFLEGNYSRQYERVNELQKAFSEASTEIKNKTEYCKRVESDNEFFRNQYAKAMTENDELKERVNKLDAKIGHKKYVPLNEQKAVQSDWWTPKRNIEEMFIEGVAYRRREDVRVGVNLLRLWSGTKSYTVQESDFMPCNSNGKPVVKHT